ncbi:NAD(P)/FAD-dependent oxidoreductase [bacterium]|nr:NAD(P)/FAD-dependent oxidoreductase [bacterium]
MNNSRIAIIIGAGPAGLTAAYKLLKETDIKPIILESENAVGGISKTVEYKGNRMDLGGHRFFTKNKEINDLWMELMPIQGSPSYDEIKLGTKKTFDGIGPDPEKEDRVMLKRNRLSRILFLHKFFDYPISLKLKTFKNMGFKRTLKSGFGYLGSRFHKLEETSLENFYINRFGRPLYEMFFEYYTENLWGRHPSEISAEWGAQRVKGLSLGKAIWSAISKPFRRKDKVETSLIEEFMYPKKGPGELYEYMRDDIIDMGGEIILNSTVNEITLDGNRITSVKTSDGLTYTGDYFISSMPIKDLISSINSEIDNEVRRVAEGLPYRDYITVGLLVKKLKLENKTKIKTLTGDVPDNWIYVQEREVKLGRLQLFNNWSPYMVSDPDNTMWIGLEYFVNEGDDMWNMSDSDFINFAIDELVKINVIDREDVLDSNRIKVKKAYPAYFDTYSEFNIVKDYLDSIENLYCIGRNGQHRYNNMDHSMLTAIEAVKCIKENKQSKNDIWNVNTEKEYHEEEKK